MKSCNEIFATKKNMAYQAKFKHKMYAMTKDFYHKKENLKLEIKATYQEMKEIQASTGYSLVEDQKTQQDGRASRRSTVYLPPIGVKLMRKYVGWNLDKLPRFLSSFPSKEAPAKEPTTENPPKITNLSSSYDLNRYEHKRETKTNKRTNLPPERSFPSDKDTKQNIQDISKHLPEIKITDISSEVQGDNNKDNNTTNVDENDEEKLSDDVFADLDDFKLSTPFRRSSRSTFRTRSSVRFFSQPSILEEHNLQVISMPKAMKYKSKSTTNADNNSLAVLRRTNLDFSEATPGVNISSISSVEKINFCLDYGDGKLHNTLKIPRVKDCSRPWCNPFCKTCQMRTTSRPCFVLIPHEGTEPPRRVIGDKRKPTLFPVYNKNKQEEIKSSRMEKDEEKTNDEQETIPSSVKVTLSKVGDRKQIFDETDSIFIEEIVDESDKVDETTSTQNSDEIVESRKQDEPKDHVNHQRKKGYSKRRMEELSQPRGCPPAEVRFSRTSLRRKQEQMVELERNKNLTEREQKNLAYIQGKISVFLAMLNQKEASKKPTKMVDIPIREEIDSDKLIHEAKKRNTLKERNSALGHNRNFGMI